jgi:hypothetical protein
MSPRRLPRRTRPPLHWRHVGVVTDQVRAAAALADYPAVMLPRHRIAAGAVAWTAFLARADLTALEHAQRALQRRTPTPTPAAPPRPAPASVGRPTGGS